MAINKVVNTSSKSHAALKNVIRYILLDEKVKQGFVEITGPYSAATINYDDIYRTWLNEKDLWDKDNGRMYAHNVISFHKDEQVTPDQVLEIGKEFCDKFFPNHQCVIGVHQDKEHLHCHIVTNSVSYIDGLKLHQNKRDLKKQKEFTNSLCLKRGLTIAEKGHHFDGSIIEEGEITAWSKDKYNLLANNSKKSYVAECAIAIIETIPESASRDDFIIGMEERGWSVQWEDNRKHIVFQNQNGDKVRDSNIEKTFSGMEINKEVLLNEFTRQNELRLTKLKADKDRERAEAELEQYYKELESAATGIDTAKAIRNDSEITNRTKRDFNRAELAEETGQTSGSRDDTKSFIREVRANISDSQSKNRAVRDTENKSVAYDEQSRTREAERRFKEQQRSEIEEPADRAHGRSGGHSDIER